jgi:hypothetical protein
MVGAPEEFDAVHALPAQFMRMNPMNVPIGVPAFSAWIVLGSVAGTPGLGSWATAHEAVSSAKMNKRRFIASSVRIAGAEPVYTRPASAIFGNLVPDRENCDGLKFTSTPMRLPAQSSTVPVAHGTRLFSDSIRWHNALRFGIIRCAATQRMCWLRKSERHASSVCSFRIFRRSSRDGRKRKARADTGHVGRRSGRGLGFPFPEVSAISGGGFGDYQLIGEG